MLQNPLLNKNNLQMKFGIFNNNINSTKNILGPKMNFDTKIPYIKKPQINCFNINNSLCNINNESSLNENNKKSFLDFNTINNLNSSFDPLIMCNNNYLYEINLNNNNIINNMNNLGRITHHHYKIITFLNFNYLIIITQIIVQ